MVASWEACSAFENELNSKFRGTLATSSDSDCDGEEGPNIEYQLDGSNHGPFRNKP